MSGAETLELVAAVTEPSRRQLLDMLLEQGESTATAMAEELPLTRQAVTKHLTVLKRAGLVEARKSGREVRYRLDVERLDQATRSLGELATTWDRRLLRMKKIAEGEATARGRRPPRASPPGS